MRAVIVAGGRGTRLLPYTTVLPKPLMPVGDMPILELLIRRLEASGVRRITVAVGHLAPLFCAYFGDGAAWGVDLDYSLETEPLGTAGPLGLVRGLDDTFLVLNGDLLTDLDFDRMIGEHRRAGVIATVGSCDRETRIDFGVIEVRDDLVTSYTEKPTFHFTVSMGVYVFEPSVLDLVTVGARQDLPDLITGLLSAKRRVAIYRHVGYWLDIGRPDDYQRAQENYEQIKATLLPPRR